MKKKFKLEQKHIDYFKKVVPELIEAEQTVDRIKNSYEWQRAYNYFNVLRVRGHIKEMPTKKNGYKINKISEMMGSFRSVIFFPDNLRIIKDGPDERRNFINAAISQCFPEYIKYYSDFKNALENRNCIYWCKLQKIVPVLPLTFIKCQKKQSG